MSEIRLIDANALKKDIEENSIVLEGVKAIEVDCAKALIDNAPTVKFSLLPADESKEEAYMRGYEHGKAEALLRGRPKGEWGKWVISEIRCPNCLEYFDTDCYSTGELNKCPCCGAQMKIGGE